MHHPTVSEHVLTRRNGASRFVLVSLSMCDTQMAGRLIQCLSAIVTAALRHGAAEWKIDSLRRHGVSRGDTVTTQSCHKSHIVSITTPSCRKSHIASVKTPSCHKPHIASVTTPSCHKSHIVSVTTPSCHKPHIVSVIGGLGTASSRPEVFAEGRENFATF